MFSFLDYSLLSFIAKRQGSLSGMCNLTSCDSYMTRFLAKGEGSLSGMWRIESRERGGGEEGWCSASNEESVAAGSVRECVTKRS